MHASSIIQTERVAFRNKRVYTYICTIRVTVKREAVNLNEKKEGREKRCNYNLKNAFLSAGRCRRPQTVEATDPLALELQSVVSCQMWVN